MIPIAYNTGSLNVRRTTTATAVLGIALVVFVCAGALMLRAGINDTMGDKGRNDVAIVIRKGSDAELSSNIDLASVGIILDGPEVKKNEKGNGIGVGEVVVVIAMEKLGSNAKGGIANVNFRGVPDNVFEIRPEARLLEGTKARPGTDECIVGTRIRGRFKNLELGQAIELKKGRSAKVVGIFDAQGSSFESEVWADVDTVRTAYGREGLVSSARAVLASPDTFDAFKARVESDKRLGLEALRERTYFEKQSQALGTFVTILGTLIAIFFSGGAMIGAMITMYASVSSRHREVGTLRALGFSRTSVLLSFLLEACMISLLGGVIGSIASLALGAVRFSMMNFATWSELVFTFHPTPKIIVMSLIAAVVMGVIGGFLPALQAARMSVIEAMRGE